MPFSARIKFYKKENEYDISYTFDSIIDTYRYIMKSIVKYINSNPNESARTLQCLK
jgi:hypothetical protein